MIAIRGACTITVPSTSKQEVVIKVSELIRHFEECETVEEEKDRDLQNKSRSSVVPSFHEKNRRLSREVSLLTHPSNVYHLDDVDEDDIIVMAAQRATMPSLTSASQLRVIDVSLLAKLFRHLCNIYQIPREFHPALCNRLRFLLFIPHRG